MKRQNFTILKQPTKSMVLAENRPCHLRLDGAVSDEMNEIGRESSLDHDLMIIDKKIALF